MVTEPKDLAYEVTPFELFFDLVFAFAVSQLSQHLMAHLTWRGGAETLILLMAILGVWGHTSWAAAIVRVDRRETHWMVLAVMVPGLYMDAAVGEAFGMASWAFIIPFLVIQLGRTAWTLVHAPDSLFREHYVRVMVWMCATTPLWLAGAASGPDGRLVWWAVAASVDQLATWRAHPLPGRRLHTDSVGFDGQHMLERSRLFLLIALGETVLATGAAIARAPTAPLNLAVGGAALFGTMSLWALAFTFADPLFRTFMEETNDPIRAARVAGHALFFLVLGLLPVAVANYLAIAAPLRPAAGAITVLVFGGPVVFLLAQAWYLKAMSHRWDRMRLIGVALLVVAGAGLWLGPAWGPAVAAAAILVGLAVIEDRKSNRGRASVGGPTPEKPRP